MFDLVATGHGLQNRMKACADRRKAMKAANKTQY